MTKIYTLLPSEAEQDQQTIVITEEVTETKTNEERVTVAQLKEKHASLLENIENLKKEADKIVEELTTINNSKEINLTVTNLPTKLILTK